MNSRTYMERRHYLVLTGTTVLSLFAGCTNETDEDDQSEASDADSGGNENTSDEIEGDNSDAVEDTKETEEDKGTAENPTRNDLPSVEIIIEYAGDWSGEINADDSSRTISGSGNDVLEVDVNEDTTSVGVTIKKEDSTDNELAVQILVDQEVEAEASANAPSGMVSLSTSI